jgi:hypothetical protein
MREIADEESRKVLDELILRANLCGRSSAFPLVHL